MAKSNNRTEQEIQEARRRRKLERQEKRVERLNEPLLVWLHKSFRVVTIAGTVVMAGLEVRNSMMVGAENMMQRVLFTALGAWLVFGLVWAGSGYRPDDCAAQSRPGRLEGVPLLPQQCIGCHCGDDPFGRSLCNDLMIQEGGRQSPFSNPLGRIKRYG